MAQKPRQEILLESGTNEMEIIEFYIGDQSFGINVQKLKEIIPFEAHLLTRIPESSDSMLGTLLLRGNTIPLIDLKQHLAQRFTAQADDSVRRVVLVCEFNHLVNGFLVDGVNQIHRVNWSDVQPLANFIDQYHPRFTGSINIDHREILIVDLEHIIAEFDDNAALHYDHLEDVNGSLRLDDRQQAKLMLAEDSALIRTGIVKVLKSAGYSQMQTFVNGQDCFDRLMQLKGETQDAGIPVTQRLNLLITDIEMPKMDGLTLCRKVKEDPVLQGIVVLLFSSLINEQMAIKCESVGADGYATKPQIPLLVEMLDKFLLKQS